VKGDYTACSRRKRRFSKVDHEAPGRSERRRPSDDGCAGAPSFFRLCGRNKADAPTRLQKPPSTPRDGDDRAPRDEISDRLDRLGEYSSRLPFKIFARSGRDVVETERAERIDRYRVFVNVDNERGLFVHRIANFNGTPRLCAPVNGSFQDGRCVSSASKNVARNVAPSIKGSH
jgi:hypothetical protein